MDTETQIKLQQQQREQALQQMQIYHNQLRFMIKSMADTVNDMGAIAKAHKILLRAYVNQTNPKVEKT